MNMLCQECGKETPDQGIFCIHCGTRINKECPACAEIIKLKAKKCRFSPTMWDKSCVFAGMGGTKCTKT